MAMIRTLADADAAEWFSELVTGMSGASEGILACREGNC